MHVALAYKNFAANRNISHIGLGVAAVNTAKVLRHSGINTVVWPVMNAADLQRSLRQSPVRHVIISAPWVPTAALQALSFEFPETSFTVNCHSNVGFLQADTNGVRLLRETMELQLGTHNVQLAGNSRRFTQWMEAAFGTPYAYLPNLYWLNTAPPHRHYGYSGGVLRVGVFGAVRLLKNIMTATGAALEIARHLGVPLELWVSDGRSEGGEMVLSAVRQMVSGLPHVTLKHNGWQTWPKFRQTIAHMHLLLQPSYTESFNMVTADGVAEGVPSVVSPAIDWAPSYWKADVDDTLAIARVGRHLLHDRSAAHDGWRALEHYLADGLHAYRAFLKE